MAAMTVEHSTAATDALAERRRGGMRATVDAVLCLVLAVILVRSFAVEGYMISTGSMAPTLPGFHKRVTCPSCSYEFAVGITDGSSGESQQLDNANLTSGQSVARRSAGHAPGRGVTCPNCGRHSIDISGLPNTQGDQLLVYKNAYLFRDPQRWEVVVFRNPIEPMQAYVKRIVGLPGEKIELLNGDLWVNGEIQRKELRRQQALKILVYDHDFEPHDDPEWKSRWVSSADATGWQRQGQAFGFDSRHSQAGGATDIHWLTYRHWIRAGGKHRTSVKVPPHLRKLDLTFPSLYPVRTSKDKTELWHVGVLQPDARDRIAQSFDDPIFQRLIAELAEKSHEAVISDEYGYNRRRGRTPRKAVRDILLECTATLTGSQGRFLVEMSDGDSRFTLTVDAATRDVTLLRSGEDTPTRVARLKAEVISQPMQLTMSLFDRQVLVAVNGHAIFDPLLLNRLTSKTEVPRNPVRIGSVGLSARVEHLRLYRDVYYTKKQTKNSYQLGDNEYFVLGDNSPISADSRVWEHCGVSRDLFLGKPFLVHLPSRPGEFHIGGRVLRVRIPDFTRIRYIH